MSTSLHLSSGAATSGKNGPFQSDMKAPVMLKGHHIRQIALAAAAASWAAILYAYI